MQIPTIPSNFPNLRASKPLNFAAVIFHFDPSQKTWVNPNGSNIKIHTKITNATSLQIFTGALEDPEEQQRFQQITKQVYHSLRQGTMRGAQDRLDPRGVYLAPPDGNSLLILDMDDRIAKIKPGMPEAKATQKIREVALDKISKAGWLYSLQQHLRPLFPEQAGPLAQAIYDVIKGNRSSEANLPTHATAPFMLTTSTGKRPSPA